MSDLPRVLVVSPGVLPVPAVRGGAVETLIESFVTENERGRRFDLTVLGVHDAAAHGTRVDHSLARFVTHRRPCAVSLADWANFRIADRRGAPAITLDRYSVALRFHRRRVTEHLRSHSYDAVLLENHPELLRAVMAVPELDPRRVVMRFHARPFMLASGEITEYLSRCNVVCVSEYLRDDVKRLVPGTAARVIHNGVDTERYANVDHAAARSRIEDRFDVPAGHRIVLFVGRLSPEKGALALARAFVAADVPDAVLLIAGSAFNTGSMRTRYSRDIDKIAREYPARIRLAGYIPHAELAEFYGSCDLLAVPSFGEEAASLVLAEGLAAGCRIVMSDAPGMTEHVSAEDPVVVPLGRGFEERLARGLVQGLELGAAARGTQRGRFLTPGENYDEMSDVLLRACAVDREALA